MRGVFGLMTLIACLASEAPMASDPVSSDPQHYKVEFENSAVRVLRVSYGPHEKSVMHIHPSSVAVFLTDIHAKFSFPSEKVEESHFKAGQISWRNAEEHLPENLSEQPFEMILVELKNKPGKPLVVKQTN
jgi:hypothetical protein